MSIEQLLGNLIASIDELNRTMNARELDEREMNAAVSMESFDADNIDPDDIVVSTNEAAPNLEAVVTTDLADDIKDYTKDLEAYRAEVKQFAHTHIEAKDITRKAVKAMIVKLGKESLMELGMEELRALYVQIEMKVKGCD